MITWCACEEARRRFGGRTCGHEWNLKRGEEVSVVGERESESESESESEKSIGRGLCL